MIGILLYAYAGNDPINLYDDFGYQEEGSILSIVGNNRFSKYSKLVFDLWGRVLFPSMDPYIPHSEPEPPAPREAQAPKTSQGFSQVVQEERIKKIKNKPPKTQEIGYTGEYYIRAEKPPPPKPTKKIKPNINTQRIVAPKSKWTKYGPSGRRGSGIIGFIAGLAISAGIGTLIGYLYGKSLGSSLKSAVNAEIQQYSTAEGLAEIGGGAYGTWTGTIIAFGLIAANPATWVALGAAVVVLGMTWLGTKAASGLVNIGRRLGEWFYDLIHKVPPSIEVGGEKVYVERAWPSEFYWLYQIDEEGNKIMKKITHDPKSQKTLNIDKGSPFPVF
jgi:hypothetical protein